MSSLANQIKTLNSSLDHSRQDHITQRNIQFKSNTTASFLFDSQTAVEIAPQTIHQMGLSGYRELSGICSLFHPYNEIIFSPIKYNTTSFNRTICSKQTLRKIDKSIKSFIRLLSPFALQQNAQKCIEFLIWFYRIDKNYPLDLLSFAFPYHDNPIFAKILQLCKLEDNQWDFLYFGSHIGPQEMYAVKHKLQHRISPNMIQKDELVRQMKKKTFLVQFVIEIAEKAFKIENDAEKSGFYDGQYALNGRDVNAFKKTYDFCESILNDYFDLCEGRQNKEKALRQMLPFLLKVLEKSANWIFDIFGSLMIKICHQLKFSDELLNEIIKKSMNNDKLNKNGMCAFFRKIIPTENNFIIDNEALKNIYQTDFLIKEGNYPERNNGFMKILCLSTLNALISDLKGEDNIFYNKKSEKNHENKHKIDNVFKTKFKNNEISKIVTNIIEKLKTIPKKSLNHEKYNNLTNKLVVLLKFNEISLLNIISIIKKSSKSSPETKSILTNEIIDKYKQNNQQTQLNLFDLLSLIKNNKHAEKTTILSQFNVIIKKNANAFDKTNPNISKLFYDHNENEINEIKSNFNCFLTEFLCQTRTKQKNHFTLIALEILESTICCNFLRLDDNLAKQISILLTDEIQSYFNRDNYPLTSLNKIIGFIFRLEKYYLRDGLYPLFDSVVKDLFLMSLFRPKLNDLVISNYRSDLKSSCQKNLHSKKTFHELFDIKNAVQSDKLNDNELFLRIWKSSGQIILKRIVIKSYHPLVVSCVIKILNEIMQYDFLTVFFHDLTSFWKLFLRVIKMIIRQKTSKTNKISGENRMNYFRLTENMIKMVKNCENNSKNKVMPVQMRMISILISIRSLKSDCSDISTKLILFFAKNPKKDKNDLKLIKNNPSDINLRKDSKLLNLCIDILYFNSCQDSDHNLNQIFTKLFLKKSSSKLNFDLNRLTITETISIILNILLKYQNNEKPTAETDHFITYKTGLALLTLLSNWDLSRKEIEKIFKSLQIISKHILINSKDKSLHDKYQIFTNSLITLVENNKYFIYADRTFFRQKLIFENICKNYYLPVLSDLHKRFKRLIEEKQPKEKKDNELNFLLSNFQLFLNIKLRSIENEFIYSLFGEMINLLLLNFKNSPQTENLCFVKRITEIIRLSLDLINFKSVDRIFSTSIIGNIIKNGYFIINEDNHPGDFDLKLKRALFNTFQKSSETEKISILCEFMFEFNSQKYNALVEKFSLVDCSLISVSLMDKLVNLREISGDKMRNIMDFIKKCAIQFRLKVSKQLNSSEKTNIFPQNLDVYNNFIRSLFELLSRNNLKTDKNRFDIVQDTLQSLYHMISALKYHKSSSGNIVINKKPFQIITNNLINSFQRAETSIEAFSLRKIQLKLIGRICNIKRKCSDLLEISDFDKFAHDLIGVLKAISTRSQLISILPNDQMIKNMIKTTRNILPLITEHFVKKRNFDIVLDNLDSFAVCFDDYCGSEIGVELYKTIIKSIGLTTNSAKFVLRAVTFYSSSGKSFSEDKIARLVNNVSVTDLIVFASRIIECILLDNIDKSPAETYLFDIDRNLILTIRKIIAKTTETNRENSMNHESSEYSQALCGYITAYMALLNRFEKFVDMILQTNNVNVAKTINTENYSAEMKKIEDKILKKTATESEKRIIDKITILRDKKSAIKRNLTKSPQIYKILLTDFDFITKLSNDINPLIRVKPFLAIIKNSIFNNEVVLSFVCNKKMIENVLQNDKQPDEGEKCFEKDEKCLKSNEIILGEGNIIYDNVKELVKSIFHRFGNNPSKQPLILDVFEFLIREMNIPGLQPIYTKNKTILIESFSTRNPLTVTKAFKCLVSGISYYKGFDLTQNDLDGLFKTFLRYVAENQHFDNEFQLKLSYQFVEKSIEFLWPLLSGHSEAIIRLWFDSKLTFYNGTIDCSQIERLMISRFPADQLISLLIDVFNHINSKNKKKNLTVLFNFWKNMFDSKEFSVGESENRLVDFYVFAFRNFSSEFHWEFRDKKDLELIKKVTKSFSRLVFHLTTSSFERSFRQLNNWAEGMAILETNLVKNRIGGKRNHKNEELVRLNSSDNPGDIKIRRIWHYSLTEEIITSVEVLFNSCVKSVLSIVISSLENSVEKDKNRKNKIAKINGKNNISKEIRGEIDSIELDKAVNLVTKILEKNLTLELVDFENIIGPLFELIASEYKKRKYEDYEVFLRGCLMPAVKRLTLWAEDKEDSKKHLLRLIVYHTHNRHWKIRLNAVKILGEFLKNIGGDVENLHAAISALCEKLEDDNEKVEMESRKVLKLVEGLTGENMDQFVK